MLQTLSPVDANWGMERGDRVWYGIACLVAIVVFLLVAVAEVGALILVLRLYRQLRDAPRPPPLHAPGPPR